MLSWYILQYKLNSDSEWHDVTIKNKSPLIGGRLRVTRAHEIFTSKYPHWNFRILQRTIYEVEDE